MKLTEAKALLEMEGYIDEKEKELESVSDSYLAYNKKVNSFLEEYKNENASFMEYFNKEIEAMHNMIDSFEVQKKNFLIEIEKKKEECLKRNMELENQVTVMYLEQLEDKLTKSIEIMEESISSMLDEQYKEYEKIMKSLDKVSSRIAKLRNRTIA